MEISNTAYYWYKQKSDIHSSVFSFVKKLDQSQGYRQTDNVRNMRLYGNYEFSALSAYNFMRTESSYSLLNRVTLNVVQSMVDTVVSKIGKNKPRPYFLTDDGDFTLQRKAEKLTKFVEGQFYACDFYEKAQMAFRDACIFGTGAIKIYKEDNEIKAERTFIDEIMIDDSESVYGQPRQVHQKKWIHKEVLKAAFPDYKGAIDAATTDSGRSDEFKDRNGDMLLVVESWKLPSGKNTDDGKHTICISNETLFKEKYAKNYFPFVFFRWNVKPLGFFGQGIPEQLTGLQLEINKILKTIQVSMHLVSVPKIFVEAGSKIVTSHLDNKIGGIIKYAGTKPTEGTLGTIPTELFSHLDRLYSRAYEIVGISQLAAQSQKPGGLDSGKALRTFNDLETERFMDVAQRREQVFLDASKIMIDYAKDIAAETDNFEVKVAGSGFLKTINWRDVEMDDDQYIMQVFPTNALSQTPAARLQEVQELVQAGFISKEDAGDLLDFPDLKGFRTLENAGAEDIKRQIELMVEKQEYQSPEPYQNLQYGIKKMQQAYLKYRNQNAPEEVLQMFRDWISDANNLMQKANEEVQATQMAAQQAAAPIAQPEAPPTSDLLPSVA
ncbi:MAG: hypothetical protein ACAH17_00135 [Candidatus Paceibacterota bacterium]